MEIVSRRVALVSSHRQPYGKAWKWEKDVMRHRVRSSSSRHIRSGGTVLGFAPGLVDDCTTFDGIDLFGKVEVLHVRFSDEH